MENNTFKILGILMIFVILSVDFVLVIAIVEDSPLSFVDYYDEYFGYGFNPPDDWSIFDGFLRRSGVVIAPNASVNNSFLVHIYKVTGLDPEMKYQIIDSFEKFCNKSFNRYLSELSDVYSKTIIYENKPLKINGLDAYEFKYSYKTFVQKVGYKTMIGKIIYVEKDKYNRLVIDIIGAEAGHDLYMNELEKCLDTIVIR